MSTEWTIPEDGGFSKAGWTPFAGRKVWGRVRTVVIRGEEIYVDGIFVGKPGMGRNLFEEGAVVGTARGEQTDSLGEFSLFCLILEQFFFLHSFKTHSLIKNLLTKHSLLTPT